MTTRRWRRVVALALTPATIALSGMPAPPQRPQPPPFVPHLELGPRLDRYSLDDYMLLDAAWTASQHAVWVVADAENQAAIAARDAEEQVRTMNTAITPARQTPRPAPVGIDDAGLARLRQCESSGHYDDNTGNNYYGAYQFDITTWNGVASRYAPAWVGVLPSDAPPAVQDQLTRALWSERGSRPWPVCGLRVGAV